MFLPIASYERRTPNAATRLVNVYPEQNPPDAKSPVLLSRAPGVAAYATVGAGPGRGLHVMGGSLYAVSGTSLYRVGNATALGTVPGTSRVQMADNGTTLVMVTTPDAYYYSGGSVAQVSDADFTARGASSVSFVDGYFTFTEPGTGRFFSSDLYSTAFDALKFATAEGSPDNLVAHIVDHRQIILFGAESTETWWNSGADNFPFERMADGFMEIGCLGGVVKLDNSVYWVANDNTIRRLNGSTPVRVSTHGVEEKIRTYTSTPYAFAYALEGHLCAVFQWDEGTWVFDATSGSWHERETYRDSDSNPWRVCDTATLNGTVYVQDALTGAVGILSPDTFAEWGETIRAEWTYPSVFDANRRLFHSRLELLCESGVGVATGQGEVPAIVLSWSDDGGRTWTIAPARDIGRIGEFRHRVQWHRLGSSRDRCYRMLVTDPVALNIYGTTVDVE
jgi:hypothetical protein